MQNKQQPLLDSYYRRVAMSATQLHFEFWDFRPVMVEHS